ncbi:MAG: RDD family protein [Polaromonas sp.]|nr:RDD family protein [Polaromonas sp.]
MTATPPSEAHQASAATALTAPPILRRMACWLYEGTLLFGVVFGTGLFVFGMLFAIGHLVPSLAPVRDMVNNRYALQAYVLLLLALYFTWFWVKGQTLAMKTWHIRVVDRLGRPLTQARALMRYVLSWLWFLPPLAVGGSYGLPGGELTVIVLGWVAIWAILSRFHPQRQFLHDAWAGTRLVHYKPAAAPRKRKFWQP